MRAPKTSEPREQSHERLSGSGTYVDGLAGGVSKRSHSSAVGRIGPSQRRGEVMTAALFAYTIAIFACGYGFRGDAQRYWGWK